MPRLIDANALMELARSHASRAVDCNDIARFPTIEAEPVRHGRWIMVRTRLDNFPCGQKCSECGRRVKNGGENYCPNCGAKMDGGQG